MKMPFRSGILAIVTLVTVSCARGQTSRRASNANADTVLVGHVSDSLVRQENWAHSPEHISGPFIRRLVVVQFDATASSAQRAAALDSVGGVIFAKLPLGDGEPFYYVRLKAGEPDSAVFSAISVLQRHLAVRRALPELILRIP